MQREKPILFSGAMVRALLDGSKTQTRRVVKLPHMNPLGQWEPTEWGGPDGGRTASGETVPFQGAIWHTRTGETIACPYGQPGDRLWVRETYADAGCRLTYRADLDDGAHCKVKKWTPAIHMFRADSRIQLEIVSVRVERLNDCSEVDAKAEGAKFHQAANYLSHSGWWHDGDHVHPTATASYVELWESINGAGSWSANPWVWVVEFRRVAP